MIQFFGCPTEMLGFNYKNVHNKGGFAYTFSYVYTFILLFYYYFDKCWCVSVA